MAKFTPNSRSPLHGLRGRIGNLVFRRHGEETVVSRAPRHPSTPPTSAQLAHRERFRDAAMYARHALYDASRQAAYEQIALRRRAGRVAIGIKDYLSPPTVEHIDLARCSGAAGDRIVIRATDSVAVAAVNVRLLRADTGAVLERGSAAEEGDWVYRTTTALPRGERIVVEVAALDWAGNSHELTQELRAP